MAAELGPLALVGGDEFHPGNEAQDRLLRDAAAGRAAFVVATAARENPAAAVRTAQRWFATLGVQIEELPVRTPVDARSSTLAAQAAGAGLIYMTGGDPGRVVQVLRGSTVWQAMRQAWLDGGALAGSSAGAMALARWSLVRAAWPGHTRRRPIDALGTVPGCAVLPHFDTFGERWIQSAQDSLGEEKLLLGLDERTAAVWTGRGWQAMGPGRVTLVRGATRTVVQAPADVEGLPPPLSA